MKKPKPKPRALLKLTAQKGIQLQQLVCVHCGKLLIAGDKLVFDQYHVAYIAHEKCAKEHYESK